MDAPDHADLRTFALRTYPVPVWFRYEPHAEARIGPGFQISLAVADETVRKLMMFHTLESLN